MLKNYILHTCVLLTVLVFSCQNDNGYVPIEDDDPIQESPVNFDINLVPYPTLSEYNFFDGTLSDLEPVYGVLPYDLLSSLFSDYAKKKRFIWMPDAVSANYVSDYSSLDFPTGTVLIKNFYYDNVLPGNTTQIIETRLMIKKEGEWTFANYVWNEEQTEATFTTDEAELILDWVENGETKNVIYRVPPFHECFTCHNKYDVPLPIGPKPQNLNRTLQYVEGSKNQLAKWVEMGYLNNNYPSNIDTTVNWEDESESLEMRARSYIDINCAHCHSEQSYCEYARVRFEYEKTFDPVNLGICVDGTFVYDSSINTIVVPGNHERSIVHNRMNSNEVSVRMPIIGRALVHIEGVQLIENWIDSLTNNCE